MLTVLIWVLQSSKSRESWKIFINEGKMRSESWARSFPVVFKKLEKVDQRSNSLSRSVLISWTSRLLDWWSLISFWPHSQTWILIDSLGLICDHLISEEKKNLQSGVNQIKWEFQSRWEEEKKRRTHSTHLMLSSFTYFKDGTKINTMRSCESGNRFLQRN